MPNRYSLILLFIILLLQGENFIFGQQFSMECWHKGTVQLGDGTTVKGLLRYDLDNDVLRFAVKNKDYTFTASTINSFFFTDFIDSTERSFISFKYTTDHDYQSPMFFEYLSDGKVPLLCREKIVFRAGGTMASSGFGGGGTRGLEYTFYVIDITGNVQMLPSKKRKLVHVFRNKEEEMKKYLKENRFNLRNRQDIIDIFKYYYNLN